MDMLHSIFLVGSAGIAIFLVGISLAGLFGQSLPISYYLSQPLNRSMISLTKVFLQRYGMSFTLILIGGITVLIAAAIMLVGIFQKALLG